MDVYVLERVVLHDGTYVEGVTHSLEVADKWEAKNPFVPFSHQSEWNQWTRFTPLEDLTPQD